MLDNKLQSFPQFTQSFPHYENLPEEVFKDRPELKDKLFPTLNEGDACPNCDCMSFRNLIMSKYLDRIVYFDICPRCNFTASFIRSIDITKPTLHLITPCMRPENIFNIHKTLPWENKVFNIRWHIGINNTLVDVIIENTDERLNIRKYPYEVKGNMCGKVRNWLLDDVPVSLKDWVYFLDDDNILAPQFVEVFSNFLNTSYLGMIVSCDYEDSKILEAKRENLYVSGVDMAQVVLNSILTSHYRFSTNMGEEDCIFINDVVENNLRYIGFYSGVASYHNGLTRFGGK